MFILSNLRTFSALKITYTVYILITGRQKSLQFPHTCISVARSSIITQVQCTHALSIFGPTQRKQT